LSALRPITVLLLALCSADNAAAQSALDLKGFVPGSSFEEAQEHAATEKLQLTESPYFPGNWEVEGANLWLVVCDETVASIQANIEGGVQEFAQLAMAWEIKFGEPDVQVASFYAGATRISIIDARFSHESGSHALQLNSYDGKEGITALVVSAVKCSEMTNSGVNASE